MNAIDLPPQTLRPMRYAHEDGTSHFGNHGFAKNPYGPPSGPEDGNGYNTNISPPFVVQIFSEIDRAFHFARELDMRLAHLTQTPNQAEQPSEQGESVSLPSLLERLSELRRLLDSCNNTLSKVI